MHRLFKPVLEFFAVNIQHRLFTAMAIALVEIPHYQG